MERFSSCFRDALNPIFVVHEIETLVAQRMFGLALGYDDILYYDELRRDPVMSVLLGKLDSGRDESFLLARKSALNRRSMRRPEAQRRAITRSAMTGGGR